METSESNPTLAHANRLILLIALTLLAYANSFEGAFVFDDYHNIIESETIRSVWPPTWNQGQRPWFYLSLALNYSIHKLDPFGYHLFNFAIHLAAGLFLFGLVRRTLALPIAADCCRLLPIAAEQCRAVSESFASDVLLFSGEQSFPPIFTNNQQLWPATCLTRTLASLLQIRNAQLYS